MALRELVLFARETLEEPTSDFGTERPGGEQDGPPAAPDWIQTGDARIPIDVPRVAGGALDQVARLPTEQLPQIYERFRSTESPSGLTPDVLAYYLPFHWYGDRSWGIYIREQGILALATGLNGGSIGPGDEPLLQAAIETLFQHEFHHLATEAAATRVEAVVGSKVYRLYRKNLGFRSHEEALANASAYRRVSGRGVASLLRAWMTTQPDGYADFDRWIRSLTAGKRQTSSNLVTAAGRMKSSKPLPLEILFAAVGLAEAPTYLVRDGPPGVIGLPFTFPRAPRIVVVVHTRDHLPPHLHVQIPPGSRARRCEWQSLQPLNAKEALNSAEHELLRTYVELHRADIEDFVRKVPWTA
jgi:hypothetical protein